MKYLCRLVTPKGGVVLVIHLWVLVLQVYAKDEGLILSVSKKKEYFEIAEARIKVSSPLMEFM